MTELEFEYLRGYLKQRSGLALTAEKRYLVGEPAQTRSAAASDLRISATSSAPSNSPATGRSSAPWSRPMTTNETFFFRDRTPFDLFKDVILPDALARNAARRKLRIWCAASSTGQEPYSLAMLLQESAQKLAGWQVEIVATDLSSEVIEKAKLGLYSHFEVQRGLPVQWLIKYFTQVGEQWHIAPALRTMVDYRQLNLLNGFEMLGQFDVIYCRNVLIYFDAPTKSDILARLAARLAPGGAILLGAAETVIGLTDRLSPNPKHRGLYGHGETTARPAAAAHLQSPMRVAAGR